MSLTPYPSPLLIETGAAVAGARLDRLRACLSLAKPRIVSLVLFTAVVAAFAAAEGPPPLDTVLLLIVTGGLAAGGAAALNHYCDRDIDARMGRTRGRPLVNGQIRRPALVLFAGLAMIFAGITGATAINPVLGLFEFAGAFVYAVVYTLWLKRRTPLNIVIGGFAGSSAVLGGWAAIDPDLGLVPWLLAGLVFLWTPAHFWSLALARRTDYEQTRVPMLPVVVGRQGAAWWTLIHILATVALSIWVGLAAQLGPIYFSLALAAGLAFLATGLQLLRRPGAATGWQTFKLSGPYLGLIYLGVLVDVLL